MMDKATGMGDLSDFAHYYHQYYHTGWCPPAMFLGLLSASIHLPQTLVILQKKNKQG